MILFIFEGQSRENQIFKTLEYLFFPEKKETFKCYFGNDIYDLYKQLKTYDSFGMEGGDGDIISVFNEILMRKGDDTLNDKTSSDFSEIFLFFDYDFQDTNLTLSEINQQLQEMLEYFYDETGNGKLYINYPMVESIRYTKCLPDHDYYKYEITQEACHHFKREAQEFSFYGSFDFILKDERYPIPRNESWIRQNWQYLKDQNVSKANYICNDDNSVPLDKNRIAQQKIFEAQLLKYVQKEPCCVAVLNSFPIFLFEYFK